jgi:hypothetical protein
MIAGLPTRRTSRLRRLHEHHWSAAERAAVIAVVAIVMGCLFIATYSLALGDPVASIGYQSRSRYPIAAQKTANSELRSAERPQPRTRRLPGISAQLEMLGLTTENRGVPGSSPGLAISSPRSRMVARYSG